MSMRTGTIPCEHQHEERRVEIANEDSESYLCCVIQTVVDERDGIRLRGSRRVIADICRKFHRNTRPVVFV